jgi:hypothetical protein
MWKAGVSLKKWLEVGIEGKYIQNPEHTTLKEHEPDLISSPAESGLVAEPQQQEAELISSSLQYLNGITVDLTSWTLWKRVEAGREHRFAKDAAGVVRWEAWYSLEPRVIL